MSEQELQKHLDYFCEKRLSECPICKEQWPMECISGHIDSCPKRAPDSDASYYDEEEEEEDPNSGCQLVTD